MQTTLKKAQVAVNSANTDSVDEITKNNTNGTAKYNFRIPVTNFSDKETD